MLMAAINLQSNMSDTTTYLKASIKYEAQKKANGYTFTGFGHQFRETERKYKDFADKLEAMCEDLNETVPFEKALLEVFTNQVINLRLAESIEREQYNDRD